MDEKQTKRFANGAVSLVELFGETEKTVSSITLVW
jgi:hypothetical protein